MKFEAMFMYWKIQGDKLGNMSCLTNDAVYKSDVRHCTWYCTVASGSKYANIIYKFDIKNNVQCNYSLIHADILFAGYPQFDGDGSSVFIKNAKVSDLCNEFVDK